MALPASYFFLQWIMESENAEIPAEKPWFLNPCVKFHISYEPHSSWSFPLFSFSVSYQTEVFKCHHQDTETIFLYA